MSHISGKAVYADGGDGSGDETTVALLGGHNGGSSRSEKQYPVEIRRWYVLAVYACLNGLQGMLWMTWSSVPPASQSYLHVDQSTLNWFLAEGPIAYSLVCFFGAWILTGMQGLRSSVLAGSAACLAAGMLKNNNNKQKQQQHLL